ncbi:Peptide-methionine (S)-S-oxide reductase [Podila verticillata]|nr:Peptide-methionine (S)-S-oxide reductase [Podila verticillata]KAI9234693.1 MAG: methionine sulfoxide reductase A [Podila humilis]
MIRRLYSRASRNLFLHPSRLPSILSQRHFAKSNSTLAAPQDQLTNSAAFEQATFAAGCFWGVEKAFQKFYKNQGVIVRTTVGYTGGIDPFPTYRSVCKGQTQHAEALQIVYTPTDKIKYADLVEFFYRMHDPTTLNSQGPDRGTQYRSAIFTHSPEQEQTAREVTAKIQQLHFKGKKIVTQIVPAGDWFDAEDYHQKYLVKNPHGYECPSHFLRW